MYSKIKTLHNVTKIYTLNIQECFFSSKICKTIKRLIKNARVKTDDSPFIKKNPKGKKKKNLTKKFSKNDYLFKNLYN